MHRVFEYTKYLIQERRLELEQLDLRKQALPQSEYLSCRRALLQAIFELERMLPRARYEEFSGEEEGASFAEP